MFLLSLPLPLTLKSHKTWDRIYLILGSVPREGYFKESMSSDDIHLNEFLTLCWGWGESDQEREMEEVQ